MLTAQAPSGFEVDREVTIRLDDRNRPEPDATTRAYIATGIHRDTLTVRVPFEVTVDLESLVRL